VHLIDVYLIGVHLGVHLIGIDVHLIGIGMRLIGTHFMGGTAQKPGTDEI
jgi:hypothetical protein